LEARALVFVIVGVVSFFPADEATVDVLDADAEGLPIEVALFLGLGLFGPRTRPSFAYSQIKPRVIHRLHEGCSPLHLIIECCEINVMEAVSKDEEYAL
jgi:hypothetical protein